MVSVSDAGIDAGALQPMGLDKPLRIQELVLENRLPFVQLVDSAGANLMADRVQDFVRGGNLFRNLARIRLDDDPGGDQRQRAAYHHPMRCKFWRRQLRHVRARLSSAILFS